MTFDLERDALRLDLAPLLESQLAGRPEPIRAVLKAMSGATRHGGDVFLPRMAQDLINVLMVVAYLRGERGPLYLAMFVGNRETSPDQMTWDVESLPAEIAGLADPFEPGALPGRTRADIVATASRVLLHVEGMLRGQSRAA